MFIFTITNFFFSILQAKDLKLTEYEQIIAAEVIHADEINVNFKRMLSMRMIKL